MENFKGVVAVPEKTACSKAIGQNKRPRKPRARCLDLRFFKAKLPLRDLKVGVKIGAWAALFIQNLITLVKVLSRSDHLVRSYIAKKF